MYGYNPRRKPIPKLWFGCHFVAHVSQSRRPSHIGYWVRYASKLFINNMFINLSTLAIKTIKLIVIAIANNYVLLLATYWYEDIFVLLLAVKTALRTSRVLKHGHSNHAFLAHQSLVCMHKIAGWIPILLGKFLTSGDTKLYVSSTLICFVGNISMIKVKFPMHCQLNLRLKKWTNTLDIWISVASRRSDYRS